MAHLIRNPKSGSEWTQNELDAYNIQVKTVSDFYAFFGANELPQPLCPSEFLEFESRTDKEDIDDKIDDILWIMNKAMDSGEESFVDGFAERLLDLLKFRTKGLHITTRKALYLQIGAEQKSAQTDVCIMNDNGIYLLIQEDKTRFSDSRERAEAQLVAEAIAAYQHNIRGYPWSAKNNVLVIPGIVMVGTYPILYKIPVSNILNNCIRSLTYPNIVTTIEKLEPPVHPFELRFIEGMLHLKNRIIISQYLEAFRKYIFSALINSVNNSN